MKWVDKKAQYGYACLLDWLIDWLIDCWKCARSEHLCQPPFFTFSVSHECVFRNGKRRSLHEQRITRHTPTISQTYPGKRYHTQGNCTAFKEAIPYLGKLYHVALNLSMGSVKKNSLFTGFFLLKGIKKATILCKSEKHTSDLTKPPPKNPMELPRGIYASEVKKRRKNGIAGWLPTMPNFFRDQKSLSCTH